MVAQAKTQRRQNTPSGSGIAVDFKTQTGYSISEQNTPRDFQNGLSTQGILHEDETMKAQLNREVEITLETALMLAPDTPVSELARQIYTTEPGLVAQVQKEWVIERFIWMLHRRRQRIKNQDQLILPGFELLPRRITFIDGSRGRLRGATLKELLEFRKALINQPIALQNKLIARMDRKLAALDRLIELVRSYSRKNPGINVAEVFTREAAKIQEGNG